MSRERLPDRRHGLLHKLEYGGFKLHVEFGFAPGTKVVREVFLRPRGAAGKGSFFGCLLDDVAVLVSRDLQHGTSAADLAERLGRQGTFSEDGAVPKADTEPASIIGAIVDLAAAVEAEVKDGGTGL